MLTGAWILALILTGAPLLALAEGGGAGDVDDTDDAPPEEGADAAPPQAEADAGPPDDVADAAPPDAGPVPGDPEEEPLPTDYEFLPSQGGEHRIDVFRPGIDTLMLTSETWDFDLYDLGDDGTGAGLEIVLGETRSILRFTGLSAIPVDDVHLHVAEPGQAPQRIALRDALYPETDDVLSPTDPDAPDDLPDAVPDAPPLSPADPDAPDAPPEDGGSGDVLLPTDPDAPEA